MSVEKNRIKVTQATERSISRLLTWFGLRAVYGLVSKGGWNSMGIRTAEEYIDSLRDGRKVMFRGKWVDDVTLHPEIRKAIDHASIDFKLSDDPRWKDLFTYAEDGNIYSVFYKVPSSASDLLQRKRAIEVATTYGKTIVTLIHEIGSDAIFALLRIAYLCDRKNGTSYFERVKQFYELARDQDLAIAVAQTDAKGDRDKSPKEQPFEYHYLKIVKRTNEGIVVRGAKVHTSVSVNSNAIIVLPTRAMKDGESAYAVSFWLWANSPGLTLVASPYLSGDRNGNEYPISSKHKMFETVTIFDDVFVPWEQVFLAGETEFAGLLALAFVDFHRFTAVSYKLPLLDAILGCANLIARYNGISNAAHVREKIARLIVYVQTVKSLLEAGARAGHMEDPGIFVPDSVSVNLAKYHFATNFHTALRDLQDLTGGLLVTYPSPQDFEDNIVGELLNKYLATSYSSAKERMQLINLISELTASDLSGYHSVLAVHAEGSIEAEKIAITRGYDVDKAIATSLYMAGIQDEPVL